MFKLKKIHLIHGLLKKRFPLYDNMAIYDIIREIDYALAECSTREEVEAVMWEYLSLRPNASFKYIKEE